MPNMSNQPTAEEQQRFFEEHPEAKAFVDSLPVYEPQSLEAKLRELQGEIRRAERPPGLPTPEELAEAIIGRQHKTIQRIALLLEESRGVQGAHHLQWFLAQIAAEVGIVDLEQGIAP